MALECVWVSSVLYNHKSNNFTNTLICLKLNVQNLNQVALF